MQSPFLFTISNLSTGKELRLFKAVRLHLLYSYRRRNCCWRKTTRLRYLRAEESMKDMIRKVLRNNWPGYDIWQCEILGSHKVIDLEANRYLKFLITLIVKERSDG